jgi:hypothetical protein
LITGLRMNKAIEAVKALNAKKAIKEKIRL